MSQITITPYGSWSSPITTDMVISNSIQIKEIICDGEEIYWLEVRPNQSGRQVIVRYTPDGSITDITPPDFNVRSRVHEYGGGAYQVFNGVIYFCNFANQRLYRQLPGKKPRALTPAENNRYADFTLDHLHQRLICIQEEHGESEQSVINSLVAISLDGKNSVSLLVSGNDFYSNPRLSPNGSWLAWLTWNHPNMPWDGCELWVGHLDDFGKITKTCLIAGDQNESIFQPEWSPGGELFFISDRNGFWNPYRWKDEHVESLCGIQAEFGLPQWVLGLSTYGFSGQDRVLCTYSQAGKNFLANLDTTSGDLTNISLPYVEYSSLCVKPGQALFVGESTDRPPELVWLNLESGAQKVIRKTGTMSINKGFISIPQEIEYTSQNKLIAYGNFYPPVNINHNPSPGETPPLIVMLHGGPTSTASLALDMKIQYWTSRGFAVLDVNYSGSTGYGRAYRERLNGNWGVLDVEDCIQGARHLASQGRVDAQRMSITGGSAGGYTALCALTFHETFTAGVSRYGIGSLETLATDTHKFESHYLDRLVGPFPAARELYRQRSPIHFIEQISAPILLLQGSEDMVVPPIQSERMYQALNAKGLPVAYVTFAGEQHGFRNSESIKRALEVELYFYSRIFGFNLPEDLEPVEIKNLEPSSNL
ncbi:MAG: peptidase [Chloroflexi bacterium GWB2_49_20]|nr:MAG: peptidase [Chloroflexi bacterium GWB2_49_20]OGN76120.1 MAG: peptidase [Chloroflexi bacterium GWC2_49_37]OGN83506.1 MAG: peptidase [Chloroflexi bacterium GWD2_49_16]HBG73907.1 peptidase [Anaerolineae bacterium]HCC79514.1 peptidase [Anaerolineae bacterium]